MVAVILITILVGVILALGIESELLLKKLKAPKKIGFVPQGKKFCRSCKTC